MSEAAYIMDLTFRNDLSKAEELEKIMSLRVPSHKSSSIP